jgi:uncharacterized membrane protein
MKNTDLIILKSFKNIYIAICAVVLALIIIYCYRTLKDSEFSEDQKTKRIVPFSILAVFSTALTLSKAMELQTRIQKAESKNENSLLKMNKMKSKINYKKL